MVTAIHALFFDKRARLTESADDENPTILPSAVVTLEIEGTDLPAWGYLNAMRTVLVCTDDKNRAFLTIDAFRSVGFHRLDIAGKVYLFGTEDSKLQLDGIQEMLSYIQTAGLSWGRQLFFADGAILRDPRIDYAWLTAYGTEIVDLGRAIAQYAIRLPVFTVRDARPSGGRILLSETMRILRRNPQQNLEAHSTGAIQVAGKRYHPRRVVIRQAEDSLMTVANRRVSHLLLACSEIAASLKSSVPSGSRGQIVTLRQQCEELLGLPLYSRLLQIPHSLPMSPTTEEMSDPRYERTFELFEQLERDLGWQPTKKAMAAFAYVQYADQIYQAFVALVLAHSLGASLAVSALEPGLPVPAFQSDRYELYYDTIPPKIYFTNWRESSSRPSEMRPDLILIDNAQRRAIIIDAKYRVERTGQLPASTLGEGQVYMQSFGVRALGIAYPGLTLRTERVSGGGNTMLQIPIRPDQQLSRYLRDDVIPSLETVMEPLHERADPAVGG